MTTSNIPGGEGASFPANPAAVAGVAPGSVPGEILGMGPVSVAHRSEALLRLTSRYVDARGGILTGFRLYQDDPAAVLGLED
jgi:hypothetical protein